LFSRDTCACRSHQESRIEPRPQRCRRFMKDCPSRGRNLIATAVTLIDLSVAHSVKSTWLFAYWAWNQFREAVLSKPLKTGILIRELLVKVFHTVGLHFLSPLYLQYSTEMT
jgi:hypothetical protein